jgi:plasmid stabilization system protein ParE
MKIITRPQFYLDLEEQIENLAERASPATAVRWHAAVERTLKQLAKHPLLGRPRPDLRLAQIRSWRVDHFRRWLIFYEMKDDTLVLLRVRYGMMDLPSMDFES